MYDGLRNKVVLITGGSRGIGRAATIKFADHGAFVIINYKENDTEAIRTKHLSKEGFVDMYKADISKEEDVSLMMKYIQERYGRIDILVNNAGIIHRSDNWRSMCLSDWNDTLNTNVTGSWIVSKNAYPLMEEIGGSIINISSIYGICGVASELAYSCSKAMIIAFTEALAKELAPKIRVNAITPGNTITDMVPEQSILSSIEEKTVLRRSANANEIADAVLYLASDNSSYVTGCILTVDGGYHLK